jgi:hypothetical protein
MSQDKCALCAEPFTPPGFKYAVLSVPPEGKARGIYRSRPVCERCGQPQNQAQLDRVLQRLVGIAEEPRS